MKKIILLLTLFFVSQNYFSQLFWREDFGTGCNQGQLANSAAPTSSNGPWSVSSLTAPFSNGSSANDWFISAAFQRRDWEECPLGCYNPYNNSLHISSSSDPGPTYLSGSTSITNKRVESPLINCSGKQSIALSFKYTVKGLLGADFCDVLFSDNGGSSWTTLQSLAITNNSICLSNSGHWESITIGLPSSADNNPNVKIGFRWQNNNSNSNDPSIGIDDIGLWQMMINAPYLVHCAQQTITANAANVPTTVTSYTWSSSPSATFTAINSSTTNIQFQNSGSYTINLFGSTLPNSPVTNSSSIVINVNINLQLYVTPPQTICVGSTATIMAAGPTTYSWHLNTSANPSISNSNSIIVTPTVTSNYIVYGVKGPCYSNSVITQINVSSPAPTITAVSSDTILCQGQSATITANGAGTYTWLSFGNSQTIIVSPSVTTNYTVIGFYGACSDTLVYTQLVSACTKLNGYHSLESDIIIFPNPFDQNINIITKQKTEITIVDLLGNIIKHQYIDGTTAVQTGEFVKGIYFIRLLSDHTNDVYKIIKN